MTQTSVNYTWKARSFAKKLSTIYDTRSNSIPGVIIFLYTEHTIYNPIVRFSENSSPFKISYVILRFLSFLTLNRLLRGFGSSS